MPPELGVREMIPLLYVLQVSNWFGILYIYFIDMGDLQQAHLGPFCKIFDPPHQGGQNCERHGFVGPDRAVASQFGVCTLASIYEGIILSLCYFVDVCCGDGCRSVSTPFSFSNFVCLFSCFDMLLTSENMTDTYFHTYVSLCHLFADYLSLYNPGPKLI